MIGSLAALILLSTLSQTQEVPDQIPMAVAELGDNFTLTCSFPGEEFGMLYWYKLNFGYMIQTIAGGTFTAISLQGQFNNSKFTVTKVGTRCFLDIINVSKEDEATYFCQAGTAYTMKMINSTLLAVNDHTNLQKSVYVMQTPETVSVEPGSSVTLQCSLLSKNKENRDECSDKHSVYWFRSGSSNPGFIYTDAITDGEQERRSCIYSFSTTIQDSSDAGTYYCALVTCGEILFGEGTTVETRQELWPLIIILGMLLACCVIVNIILIFSRKQKSVCDHCNGDITVSRHAERDISAENQPSNLNGEIETINYVALDFPSRRPKRRNMVELPEESLYTFTRA